MAPKDIPSLEAYIADKSYIEGYSFSSKDVEVTFLMMNVALLHIFYVTPTL
jgi:hypothetical protein